MQETIIPTKICTEYFKKARGKLIAECNISTYENLSTLKEVLDYKVSAEVIDADGEVVSRTTVNWRLAPIE